MEGRVRVHQTWKGIPGIRNSLAEAQRYLTIPVTYSLPWWLGSVYPVAMSLDITFCKVRPKWKVVS